MDTYAYREGLFDSVTTSMRPIDVRNSDDSTVGSITRGDRPGCEKTGTFCFTPLSGPATTMGIRTGTVRTVVSRLLKPSYEFEHHQTTEVFSDRLGENFLYFAVSGTLHGQRILAREDWNGSIKVTARGDEIGRFRAGGMLTKTSIDVANFTPESAQFGLLILLPLIHRIYKDEVELLDSLLG